MNVPSPRLACYALFGSALVFASSTRAADYSWVRKEGSVALQRGATVVWQFNHGPEQPKPFFHPVSLPDGRLVTWDRPPDHAWHHGLWFSWKFINGLNYWEPDQTGKPPGRTNWSDVSIKTTPDHAARIEMKLSYHPGEKPSVLSELRTINISAPDERGQFYFDWIDKFTAGDADVRLDRTPLEDEPGGKAWGGYAGLSIRLAEKLTDRDATCTKGPVEFNAQSRSRFRATATDYHGLVDGRPLGVAVCDHPDNLNHPTPWYVIRSGHMSYFSPAVICYEPYTLKAGQSLSLRYRIIIHPGRWDAETLTSAYEQFVNTE